MGDLYLPVEARAQLEEMVRRGYPFETCGLLVGRQRIGGVEVVRVAEARNLNQERAHDRYDLDPQDFLIADEQARTAGLEIVGVWHSHPDHPARPSETDRASAWEGWSYMIVSVTRDSVTDLRSWRLTSERFVEETITSCPV
ncbi:MAG: Mov34/MPN/PAD-1 family protein [Acidiferrobacterales bacterium]